MWIQDRDSGKGVGIGSRRFVARGVGCSWQWLGMATAVVSFLLAGMHFAQKKMKFALSPALSCYWPEAQGGIKFLRGAPPGVVLLVDISLL